MVYSEGGFPVGDDRAVAGDRSSFFLFVPCKNSNRIVPKNREAMRIQTTKKPISYPTPAHFHAESVCTSKVNR
jgi:hypothetical protein